MFDAWPNATPSADNVRAYVTAVDGLSLEAVVRSVKQFTSGLVERNNAFVPAAAEFAENVRAWERALIARGQPAEWLIPYRSGEPLPEGTTPHGGHVDFGRGRISLVGLTADEQNRVLSLGGIAPSGENLAGLPLEQIRQALTQNEFAQVEGGKSFAMPKLGRMT